MFIPPLVFFFYRDFLRSCSSFHVHAWRACALFISLSHRVIYSLLVFLLLSTVCFLSADSQSITEFSLTHYHHSNCTVVHFLPLSPPPTHTHIMIVFSLNCSFSVFLFVDVFESFNSSQWCLGTIYAIIQCLFVWRINTSTDCLVKQEIEKNSLMVLRWIKSLNQISSPICWFVYSKGEDSGLLNSEIFLETFCATFPSRAEIRPDRIKFFSPELFQLSFNHVYNYSIIFTINNSVCMSNHICLLSHLHWVKFSNPRWRLWLHSFIK